MSHVSDKVRLLYHTYLWYSPNIQASLKTLVLSALQTRKNSYAVTMFTGILMER